MDIVKQVGKLKAEKGEACFLKPDREAMMVSSITQAANSHYPEAAIAGMWRQIISSSINTEQQLQIGCLASMENQSPYWLAREYFGSFVPITLYTFIGDMLEECFNQPNFVGIVPTNFENWWEGFMDYADSISIFASLPAMKQHAPMPLVKPCLAFSQATIAPTNLNDISLGIINRNDSVDSIDRVQIIDGNDTHFLIQAQGCYMNAQDHPFDKLHESCSSVTWIGCYTEPFGLH